MMAVDLSETVLTKQHNIIIILDSYIKDRITNVEVLQRMHTSLHFMSNMKKRKLEYAGHVMRGSSGETHILEGKMYGKRPRGRPRRIWMDDITEWTGLKTYGEAKRIAEVSKIWKSMVVNLLLEDDRRIMNK